MCEGKIFDLFTYLLAKQNAGGGGGSAGGINFKSVSINDNNTITVVDIKDNSHILTPTYNGEGIITSIIYDDINIPLVYDSEGNLIKIGDSNIDVREYIGVGIVPTGTYSITQNGEYNIASYENAIVSVAGGGISAECNMLSGLIISMTERV